MGCLSRAGSRAISIIEILFAILIGISLGLLGGGGSILTVPFFVYVLKYDPKVAIPMSLFIVGLTSLFASVNHWRNGNINLKGALSFGAFGMLGAFISAKFISSLVSGNLQLVIFALLMFIASYFMIKGKKPSNSETQHEVHVVLSSVSGFAVGTITGLVGIGGGFMIVPALVLLLNIPMKEAIGSSLLIIFLQAAAGVLGYLSDVKIPVNFAVLFTSLAMAGSLLGSTLVNIVPAQKLRKGFGIFLIFIASFVLWKSSQGF